MIGRLFWFEILGFEQVGRTGNICRLKLPFDVWFGGELFWIKVNHLLGWSD